MEPRPPAAAAAKKLWKLVRIMFFMMKEEISKRKLMIDDLHLIFNRSKLAGKAIGDRMIDHYSSITCRSSDPNLAFISPREYEFSCSNSPNFLNLNKRKQHLRKCRYDDVTTVTAVQKVLEMLNNEMVETSPLNLPGFGKSPKWVRQLRVTDSPFPAKDTEVDGKIDAAAEEFIKKFRKDLKMQKKKAAAAAAIESQSPYHYMWDR